MVRRSLPDLPLARAVAEPAQVSPDWVRISMASAITLGMRSGRFTRDFPFGGINLLLNYDEGCLSDCGYCGLARTRPGRYEDKSFIRVEWPLVRTQDLVDRMVEHAPTLTRLCISMVTHGHAFRDTCTITRAIRERVEAPLSILVAPPTLTRERLQTFRDLGVDMIGIGLDAVTEDLFRRLRTLVPAGGLSWAKYWEVVADAREIFGPWKVNCHTLVGLGETDADLVEIFCRLADQEIFSYLFCFNPEPDSRLGGQAASTLRRWRRAQLVRHLVEVDGLRQEAFSFDASGTLTAIHGAPERIQLAVDSGVPFLTNGCPGPAGEPGCTRPYGSYRPSEPFRDYPFAPDASDLAEISDQLVLAEVLSPPEEN